MEQLAVGRTTRAQRSPILEAADVAIARISNVMRRAGSMDVQHGSRRRGSDNGRVVSFDVFDTAITRTIYPPSAVWLEAGKQLGRQKGFPEGELEAFAHAFAAQRLCAEYKAGHLRGLEDVTLTGVYRAFVWLESVGITRAEGLAAELRVEEQLIRPINKVLREVAALQRDGERVIFISDTFHSKYTVLRLLRRAGYRVDADQIYVSSAVGLTKASGNLYQHVLRCEGIRRSQLWHCGDNRQSDVVAARRRGIHSRFFELSHSNRFERSFGRQLALPPTVASNVVGLLRGARMAEEQAEVGATVAAGVVAPMVTCFASWVLQQAREHKADLILFIARDAEIIQAAATQLAEADTPPMRVFETARRSVFSSMLDPDEPQTFADLLTEPERTPLRIVLRRFHLTAEEIESGFSSAGCAAVLDEKRVEWDPEEIISLLRAAALLDQVTERATRARDAFREYCRRQGLSSASRPLFVDVGWRGTYQKILARLVTEFGFDWDWRMAYFGFAYLPAPQKYLPGRCFAYAHRFAWWSHDCETSWDYQRHVEVVEAVCTPSPSGPVVTYTNEGTPGRAVRAESRCTRHSSYAAALHQLVTKFAAEFKAKGLHRIPAEEFRAAVLANLAMFLRDPKPDELSHLIDLRYASGFDNVDASDHVVTMKLPWRQAPRLFFLRLTSASDKSEQPDLRRYHLAVTTWPKGLEVLAPRSFLMAVALFRRMKDTVGPMVYRARTVAELLRGQKPNGSAQRRDLEQAAGRTKRNVTEGEEAGK